MEGIDVARCARCAGDPVVVRVAGLPLCSACARREAETRVDGGTGSNRSRHSDAAADDP